MGFFFNLKRRKRECVCVCAGGPPSMIQTHGTFKDNRLCTINHSDGLIR